MPFVRTPWPRCRMAVAVAMLAAAPLAVLAGCGAGHERSVRTVGEARGTPPLPQAGCARAGAGTAAREMTVRVPGSGGERVVRVRVPAAALRGRPSALLVGLHGGSGSGAVLKRESNLDGLVDSEGFIVAYPTALGSPTRWNRFAGGADDVGFVEDLIERVAQVACVDPGRVYVAGLSNGGGLAALIGCELSGRVSGIVVVAGTLGGQPTCRPSQPVSVLEIHGTDDPQVPYRGTHGPGGADDVSTWLRGWAERDGCTAQSPYRRIAANALMTAWSGCRDGTRVEHIRVVGGGHGWPGAAGTSTPGGVSATAEAARFLGALPVRAG